MKTRPFLITAVAALLASSASLSAATVLLDPGHGGKDAGATENGLKESEWALAFAKLLEAELKKQGHVVILTRTEDQFLPLKDREVLAEQNKADVVIGLHLSSSKNTGEHGIRIYRCPRKMVAGLDPKDGELADQLSKRFTEEIDAKPTVSTGHLGRPFLGKNGALLLELGYVSNPDDLKNIRNAGYQEDLIKALSAAIEEVY